MVEAKKKKDEKIIMPEYNTYEGGKAFNEFYDLHINKKGEPAPLLRREKRLKGHRANVSHETLEKVINGEINLMHLEEEGKKKEAAAQIVQYLVEEGYKHYLNDATKPKTAKDIENYLRIAGIQASHDQLIKEIMSMPNLSYENLPEESQLRKLIDHIASARDPEAQKVEKLQMYIGNTKEVHEDVKKAAGERMGLQFGPGSDISDVFGRFRTHIGEKQAAYQAKYPSPSVKPAGVEPKKDKKYHGAH